ncbi:MAG: hypothetical protein A3E78_07940 [Alphaproteobacteria bacterium RIFCSPHIGHO2_12_FULL_63_12]|nr:MAG: hypothetical protein A3E78_07940 [Alphaproteobacteria bacterium RIFCSPHIGHO2_12_FULL_63_12]
MPERLKQIWGGFERVTERSLTGRGVENIDVPNRREYQAQDEMFLPKSFSPPADAAFTALKHRLSAGEQRALRKEERRARSEGRSFSAPPAPLSGDAPETLAPDSVRDLIRGLHSTEMRTQRRDFDYASFAAANPKATPKLKSRKKLFGIF